MFILPPVYELPEPVPHWHYLTMKEIWYGQTGIVDEEQPCTCLSFDGAACPRHL